MFLVSLTLIYGILSEDYLTTGIMFVVYCLYYNNKNPNAIQSIFFYMFILFYKRYIFDVPRYEFLTDTYYTFQLLNIFNICPCELYEKEEQVKENEHFKVPILIYLPPILFILSYKFFSRCMKQSTG